MNFDQAFEALLGNEGGYSNNPADPGGETMWGVTIAVARANGYLGPMKDLPQATAKGIYRALYWDACRCDDMPSLVRFDLFDAAVNSGAAQASRWLQRAVAVPDDGVIGPQTIAAAKSRVPWRVKDYMVAMRLVAMTDMKGWAAFGRGWAKRIAHNLAASTLEAE